MKRSRANAILHATSLDMSWDDGDPWGSAMAAFFAVALVLDASDIAGDASPEPFARWQYRRAPFTVPSIETITERAKGFNEGEWSDDFDYQTVELAVAYENGTITQEDLIYLGDILSRYSDVLRALGKDY